MSGILLTKSSTFIIGPVATLLGYIMNAIFVALDKIGIPNIGIAIIIFTIVINLLLMPLTIKQQKFSKLQAKMAPELQAIQKKYEGRKDQDSIMALNAEQKEVYAKYGVSPSGSCVQLLIQMPILFALYRVIYNIPAYVPSVKDVFTELVDKLANIETAPEFLTSIENFKNASYYSKQFKSEEFVLGSEYMKNTFIDILNKASTAEWMSLKEKYSELANVINNTYDKLNVYNNFLGINIANSPWYTIKESLADKNILLIFICVLIPLLAAGSQFLTVKLMPQPENQSSGNETADNMMQSMKMMNYTMPLFSAYMCFVLPTGIGIYWACGPIIRCIQQVFINRHIDTIDFDEVIKKNQEKAAKKVKKEVNSSLLVSNASIKTKTSATSSMTAEEREAKIEEARAKNMSASSNSIAAKANLVKEYNEKNSSK